MKERFRDIRVEKRGLMLGVESDSNSDLGFSANFPLFLIHEAWHRGLDLEQEADGFGIGAGTNGDWSGIRDSSDGAINTMLQKALNFLFPKKGEV